MANIFTNLNLTADSNFFITQKINSIGYVGENTVTRLNIEVLEITEGATYELETENSAGEKNVALFSVDTENSTLYLDFTANMLTVNDLIMMQLRVTYADNSIKKSNRFAMKIAKSISATSYYEEYAVTIFDQLVNECRDIIEGAESYAIRAETAATNAEAYSESASASASTATTAATTASTASTAAVNAATSAESASTAAHTSAETATTAANSASASASTAQTSAQTATSASVTAQSASEAAQTASTAATSAATSAENSASSASTAANNANASASNAASSASNASNSATSATTAASNAATSETNAASSAASASTSAANANTSATNAANSATSAATSATNAHNSEVNASNSETNASTSATEAAASAESIAASVAQINENTYRINDLEAIIAGYQRADLPTGAVASVTDGTALLMPSLKIGIEPVQSGSGVPSPENIRPISGWTAANVTRTGKNLTDGATVGHYIDTDGTLGDLGSYRCTDYVNIDGIAKLKASVATTYPNFWSWRIASYDINKNFIELSLNRTIANGYFEEEITLPSNAKYIRACAIVQSTNWNIYDESICNTYTIQFKDGDNPLTVYGGTLDVTSGELVVDRALLYADGSFNVNSVGYDSNTQLYYTLVKTSLGAPRNNPLPQSDKFNPYVTVNIGNCYITNYGNYLIVILPDQSANTVAKATQWFADNPSQFVYELAEPITYHLTPTQIRTLVGNNNIWADTGDIISGKYYKSLN